MGEKNLIFAKKKFDLPSATKSPTIFFPLKTTKVSHCIPCFYSFGLGNNERGKSF